MATLAVCRGKGTSTSRAVARKVSNFPLDLPPETRRKSERDDLAEETGTNVALSVLGQPPYHANKLARSLYRTPRRGNGYPSVRVQQGARNAIQAQPSV